MTIRVSCTAECWEASFTPGDHAPLVLPSTLTISDVFAVLQREFPGAEITIELLTKTNKGSAAK
jgi:hypothetical protein